MSIISKLKQVRTSTANAANDLNVGVQQHRDRIAELKDEYKRVAALKLPQVEIMGAVDRDLDRIKADALRDLYLPSLLGSWTPSMPELTPKIAIGLLIAANRENFRAIFENEIAGYFEDGDGITAEDRVARLAKIDTEIEETERLEEATIRTAEAAGVPIMRRPDAWPDALLMSDRALGLA